MKRFFQRAAFSFGRLINQSGIGLGDSSFKSIMEALNKSSKDVMVMIIYSSRLALGPQHQNYFNLVKSRIANYLKKRTPVVYSSLQGDIIIVASKVTKTEERKLVEKIRHFFAEDVLSGDLDGGENNDSDGEVFYRSYHLPDDKSELLKDISQITKAETELSTPKGVEKFIRTDNSIQEITTDIMAEIENYVEHINISQYIQSQPICQISDDGNEYTPIRRELYVSIDKLQRDISPTINIMGNPWLFLQLTNLFDRKVLQYLCGEGQAVNKLMGLSINLNLASVLSVYFNDFNMALSSLRESSEASDGLSITIELQKVDIFNDIGAYNLAKEIIRENGHKVCIDGLTPMTMQYINWASLSPDIIKIYWDINLRKDISDETIKNIKKYIKDGGDVILSRCDCADAIKWGKENGIKLFQGWEIDKHLMPGYSGDNGQ